MTVICDAHAQLMLARTGQVTTPSESSDVGILDRKSLILGVLERRRDYFRSCRNRVCSERQW